MFQYPTVFQEFVESAFIGCLTIATVRDNSDWLLSGNARDNVCDLHLAGFSIDKNMPDCLLCFSTILKNKDRNPVKSRSEVKVQEGILSLQFIVHKASPYICRSCVGKLRKRRGLYASVRKIEDKLFSDYSSKAFKAGLTVKKKDRDTRKGQRRNFGFSREANCFGGVGRSFVERSQFAGYDNSCESCSQCFCEKNSHSSSYSCSTSDHGAIRGKQFWYRKQNCVITVYAKFKTRTAGYWNTISNAVSQTSLFHGWKEIGDICTQARVCPVLKHNRVSKVFKGSKVHDFE